MKPQNEKAMIIKDGQEYFVETIYTPVRKTILEESNVAFTEPTEETNEEMIDTPNQEKESEYGDAGEDEVVSVDDIEPEETEIETEQFIPEKCDDQLVLYAQLEMHIEMANRCVIRIAALKEEEMNNEG